MLIISFLRSLIAVKIKFYPKESINQTDKIILKSGLRCEYHNVVLCKDGKTKRCNINYLVCFAFCENQNNYNSRTY